LRKDLETNVERIEVCDGRHAAGDMRYGMNQHALTGMQRPAGSGAFALQKLAGAEEARELPPTIIEPFRAIADSAGAAVITVNSAGTIVFWSKGAQALFGYPDEEALGRPLTTLIPAHWRGLYRRRMKRFDAISVSQLTGRTIEFQGRRKDESEFPLDVLLTCWEAAGERFYGGIVRDITQRACVENALRVSERRFRKIADALPTLVAIYQGTGHKYVNAAAETLLGYRPGELLPNSFVEYVHPDCRDEILRRSLARQRGESEPPRYELQLVTKDGRALWVDFAAARIEYEGQPAVLGIATDITTNKQMEATLRESEERFRNAFDHAPSGMYICGLEGEWLRVNQSLCAILGRSREQLLGTAEMDITHPDDREKDLANSRRLLADEIAYFQIEKRYLRKDGQIVWALLGGSLVRDPRDKPLYFVGHVHDISERKRNEERLNRYADALARSNADLQQFASVASHDLQAPLRGVAGFCRLLEKNYGDRFDEQGKRWLRLLIQDALNMEALVQGLLRFSRVDSGGKPLTATDSGAAVDQALAHVRSALEECDGQVTRGELPVVAADADQLVDVFQNLIGNALKYRGDRAPHVHISVKRLRNEWIFSVRDNGIGIDPKYHNQIFGMFQRLHVAEEYPGTGIGLTLCKRILERHGGRIWVESTPGQGSEFFFSIPASLPQSSGVPK
jgi:PAS domain S-box-containing protein